MIKTAQTNIAGPMDKAEAQAITDRIRNGLDSLSALLLEARDRKAFKALGYATWDAYVSAEFSISLRRSYQLVDHETVNRAIAEAAGPNVNHGTQISERAARDIKADLPAVTAEIKQRVDAGEEPGLAVEAVVKAKREEKAKAKVEAAPDAQEASSPAAQPAKPKADPKPEQPLYNGLSAEDRIAELEDEVRALESDNAALKAKLATFERLELMYRDWTEGGWEKVVQAKDDTIAELQRTAQSRIARESGEKWKNLRDLRAMGKKLDEAGKGRDVYIDLDGTNG